MQHCNNMLCSLSACMVDAAASKEVGISSAVQADSEVMHACVSAVAHSGSLLPCQGASCKLSHLSMFCGVAGASRLDKEASDKADNYANETASSGVAATPSKTVPPSTTAAKTDDEASRPKATV